MACSGHFLKLSSAKFAPQRENDFREKKAPRCMFGALLEVKLRKICITLWRQSDLEVKTVKASGARDVFGSSNCVLRGKRTDFGRLQNTWQAQEFVRVAEALAGLVDLKRVRITIHLNDF